MSANVYTHNTPYGIVKSYYNPTDDEVYDFTLYRLKDQAEPLTMAQIGEIIEGVENRMSDTTENAPLRLIGFMAQLMQQHYKVVDKYEYAQL